MKSRWLIIPIAALIAGGVAYEANRHEDISRVVETRHVELSTMPHFSIGYSEPQPIQDNSYTVFQKYVNFQ